MARRSRKVEEALQRWVGKGLVSPEQATSLRAEADREHRSSTRRWGQIIMAVLGAFALLMAAVMFAQQTWASLSGPVQTGIILAGGGLVYFSGLVVHGRVRWRYSALLLQAGGLLVVLLGIAYSTTAFSQGTGGARLIGLLAILVPALTARRSLSEGVAMTGAHTALSIVFLGLFFHRTLGLEFDVIVWILDAVVLIAIVATALRLRSRPEDPADRALASLAVSLWAGVVLAFLTGGGPLELGSNTLIPVDLWLLLVAGVTLWAIHNTLSDERSEVYEWNLALCVLTGGFLAMVTGAEVMNMGSEVWGPMGGVVGGLALAYGLRNDSAIVLRAGAAVILLATWIFALDQAGAIGGVLALVATAVLFFWLATRLPATPEDTP